MSNFKERNESFARAMTDAQVSYIEAERTACDLEADNRKLRELAHAAWKCIHTGASCSDCRMIAGGCTLQTAMRELGIEVDG